MKIFSWNVNGLRAVERKGELASFLERNAPDVLCMQETKAQAEQLQELDMYYPDYQKYYNSAEKKGYSGTAIWIHKNRSIKKHAYIKVCKDGVIPKEE